MEYVRGLDLGSIISRDGPLPWSRAAPLLAQICGALAEAHELGIVHRDLKPENVLITRTGNGRDYAKVLDFGLAKLEQPKAPTTATDRQQIVGTPYFMSPEQIRGDDVDRAQRHLLVRRVDVRGADRPTPVHRLDRGRRADEAPHRRSRRAVDARAEARHRSAGRCDLQEGTREGSERAVPDRDRARRGDRRGLQPTPSATRPAPGSRSRNRAFAIPDRGERERCSPSPLRHRRVRARHQAPALRHARPDDHARARRGRWCRVLPDPRRNRRSTRSASRTTTSRTRTRSALTVTGHLGKRHSPEAGDRDTFIVPWPADDEAGRHRARQRAAEPRYQPRAHRRRRPARRGRRRRPDRRRRDAASPLDRRLARDLDRSDAAAGNEAAGRERQRPLHRDRRRRRSRAPARSSRTAPTPTRIRSSSPRSCAAISIPAATSTCCAGWATTGTFNVVVRADGIPTRRGGSTTATPRTPGAASVQLQHGDLIRIERTDKGQKGPLPGRDQPWSIAVTK